MDFIIIIVLILLNGLFAMSEIAIVSSRQARLQQASEEGDKGAAKALALAQDPVRLLSTVQVGITLIGILSGAFGESIIAEKLERMFLSIPLLQEYAKPLSWVLMVIILTYFSLVLGELVPKRLGLLNPEAVAKLVAQPLEAVSRAVSPLVYVLGSSTNMLLRLLGARKNEDLSVIEEEIHSLIRQGAESGALDVSEHDMVKNVLHLDDRQVGSIMTFRKEMFFVNLDCPVDELLKKLSATVYSRIPVCRDSVDNVVGILYKKDLVGVLASGDVIDVEALLHPPLFVPRYANTLQLLEQFKASKSHVAIVTDEHGHTCGIVSVNDVMAAIVGDLPAEGEESDPDFVQRADGSWLVNGQTAITGFKDKFRVRQLPDEEHGTYHTVGGLVLTALGRVPKAADRLELNDVVIEVVDMDGNRVDKVLVQIALRDTDSLEAQSSYRD